MPRLYLDLGWLGVHGFVGASLLLSARLKPRHIPVHRRVLDKTVCGSSGGRMQEEVQPSFQFLGFRPSEFETLNISVGPLCLQVMKFFVFFPPAD